MRKATPYLLSAALFVAWLGFVAVPNLLIARNRSFEKRTMADMRTLAQALEARATDQNTYGLIPADAALRGGEMGDLTKLRPVAHRDLARALTPTYIRNVPKEDGWGNEFDVRVANSTYTVRSPGSDGRTEGDKYAVMRTNTRFDQDIVFSEGTFLVYPEGL
ncbi:MAG TPA: hypothetical protein VE974_09065 [Thermoanaerobaculia bacterium]|nr:hypothetical protein [Thermoanaerobaculia bacterium]